MLNPKNLAPGQEQYEKYRDRVRRKSLVQYDYRAEDGKLFSCVRPTLEACRAARDTWEEARK